MQTAPTVSATGEQTEVVDTQKAQLRFNRKTGKQYVNQYEVQRKLGQGSYGSVYLAVDTQNPQRRRVALKVMNTKQLIEKKGTEKAAHSVLEGLLSTCLLNLIFLFRSEKRNRYYEEVKTS